MSVNLADITFPNYVTGIKDSDGEWFKGGYDYQTGGYGNWKRKTLLREVKHINFSDYQWTVDGAGEYSEPIELFKYANGYSIKGVFRWELYSEDLTRVYVTINWYDLNGNALGDIVSGYQAVSASSMGYARGWGILENAILDMYLVTVYYPDVDPSDGSSNHGLDFIGIIGFPDQGYIMRVPGTDYDDGNGKVGYFYLARWSELSTFSTYLHSHGDPFDGDPFTDEPIPDDPAGSDDTSEPGGGGGNYDDTSDPIDFPALPQGGALVCGAVKAHRVSSQTLEALFAKLWSSTILDIQTMWQKSLQDPMDAIVSLHALPVSPEVDGSTEIQIGNFSSGLSSPEVTSQYVEVDCGTLDVKEFWGSALDYSPYTRAEIFFPFIGVKDVAVEDIMRTSIHIKYHIDVLTGECIAFLKCGISVLYRFKGNCKMNIPLSSASMDLIQNTLGAMGHVVSSAAIGGAVGGGAGALAGTVMSSAANVASTKIRTSKSSDMSGSSSLMDDFVPYLILHRPIQSLAKNYNKFKGYPSNITAKLGNLSGYTEVEHIHLQGIPNATDEEMNEIVRLLKKGVII